MAFALSSIRAIFLQVAPHRVRFHSAALLRILLLYKRSPHFPTRRQKAQSRRPVRVQNRGVRAAVSWRRSLNPVVAKDYRRPPTFRPISESSVECPRVIGGDGSYWRQHDLRAASLCNGLPVLIVRRDQHLRQSGGQALWKNMK